MNYIVTLQALLPWLVIVVAVVLRVVFYSHDENDPGADAARDIAAGSTDALQVVGGKGSATVADTVAAVLAAAAGEVPVVTEV